MDVPPPAGRWCGVKWRWAYGGSVDSAHSWLAEACGEGVSTYETNVHDRLANKVVQMNNNGMECVCSSRKLPRRRLRGKSHPHAKSLFLI